MPKVTYAVPCYNMEKFLPVALESCLYQSEGDIEVLVVNDGSKDRSGEIADLYAAQDPRVRVIHQDNQGLGMARMVGQTNASGEFITWLDADDFLDKSATKDMYGKAREDDVDAVCGNAVVFSAKTFNTRRYFYKPEASRLTFATAPEYWKSKVVWRWIYRLDTLKELGITHNNYKMGQDVCFNFEILPKLSAFSQCGSFFYYFQQEHKSNNNSMEILVEHELGHHLSSTKILLEQDLPKVLVKYLQENFFRDTKKAAGRIAVEGEHWRDRWLEIGLEVFDGVDASWFSDEFLNPEVQCDKKFVPIATALCRKDEQAAIEGFNAFTKPAPSLTKTVSGDKTNGFHTWRRHMKSMLKPLSLKTRFTLHRLEHAAQARLEKAGFF